MITYKNGHVTDDRFDLPWKVYIILVTQMWSTRQVIVKPIINSTYNAIMKQFVKEYNTIYSLTTYQYLLTVIKHLR